MSWKMKFKSDAEIQKLIEEYSDCEDWNQARENVSKLSDTAKTFLTIKTLYYQYAGHSFDEFDLLYSIIKEEK